MIDPYVQRTQNKFDKTAALTGGKKIQLLRDCLKQQDQLYTYKLKMVMRGDENRSD